MENKIVIEQDLQNMIAIMEALSFYKENGILPRYRGKIDDLLNNISKQLERQDVKMLANNYKPRFSFGERVTFENNDAIIIGVSDDDGFIKIAISNSEIEIIDVPIVLIDK